MIPHRVFAVLTTVLVGVIVAVAILFAFQALLAALGDESAATVIRWIAVGGLLLLFIDVLLLVGALGINAMKSNDSDLE